MRRVQYDGAVLELDGTDANKSLEEIRQDYIAVYGNELQQYDIAEDETGLITFNPRPGTKGSIF